MPVSFVFIEGVEAMRIPESKCQAHKLIARFNAQQTYVSGAFEATRKLQ
jgi:hypothetical protein